ncbi:hypothetical protein [Glaciimonas soli]|nr:hypothetical protein [Glaciimonas soli]
MDCFRTGCIGKIRKLSAVTYQLHYDGQRYVLPKSIQAMMMEY